MWTLRRTVVTGFIILLALSSPAYAGMPQLTLSDLAAARLDSISFFLGMLLLFAWIVKVLWNSLGKDFKSLPQLSYLRALMLVTLWGLLFVLVLTMISGTRELLTPGAWEKQGVTYRLKDGGK